MGELIVMREHIAIRLFTFRKRPINFRARFKGSSPPFPLPSPFLLSLRLSLSLILTLLFFTPRRIVGAD